jgi:hypothetical protein
MKRRTFLQRFGSILAVSGATVTEWLTLGNRYYQALAQPSLRKLALLVGINQYLYSPPLTGSVTDVELQKELLVHRFGFQPSDVLTVTEEKATRELIEAAFMEHLVKQAQPGDLIVFHFSGYGSRVKLGTSSETWQNALLPVDERLSLQEELIVNYWLEETLLLMLRLLLTDRVTAVLDTSYYTPTWLPPTGLKSRSRQAPVQATVVTAELNFQQQLKEKNLIKRVAGDLPSVILSATSNPNQIAREMQFSGFSAGVFTYALTQYLWEATPATTIQTSLSRVASSIQQLGSSKQQPDLLIGKKNQLIREQLGEIFLPKSIMGAEGVIIGTEDDGKIIQVWLAGLPPQVLEHYGVNSRLTLVESEGSFVQLRSRNGLRAKAQVSNYETATTPQVGQLLQEAVRVLPRNINLVVALDTGLERIERVDATSAFATIPRVSNVVAGEQPADYVFGKLPEPKPKDQAAINSMLVSFGRYGLFTLGSELIPNTVGEAGEAVKLAVMRLSSKLQGLLAAKLWRLTQNEASSRLNVKATLEIIDTLPSQALIQRQTVRTQQIDSGNGNGQLKGLVSTPVGEIPTVSIGSRIQYRVQNMSNRPIYLMLFGLNSDRNAIALYPWHKSPEPYSSPAEPLLKNVVISAGETLTVPQTTAGFEWVVQGPASLSETLLIFSTAPFNQTLSVLEAAKHGRAQQQRVLPLLNPVEATQAVLQDLHNASTVKAEMNGSATDSYILDVNNWASLSFIYQVV